MVAAGIDGGKNESADNDRADASLEDRALRPAGAPYQRLARPAGRLARAGRRADQPAPHPPGAGAALRAAVVTDRGGSEWADGVLRLLGPSVLDTRSQKRSTLGRMYVMARAGRGCPKAA